MKRYVIPLKEHAYTYRYLGIFPSLNMSDSPSLLSFGGGIRVIAAMASGYGIDRTLGHATYRGHVLAVVTKLGIDHVGFFRLMGTDSIAGTCRTASVTHHTFTGIDRMSHDITSLIDLSCYRMIESMHCIHTIVKGIFSSIPNLIREAGRTALESKSNTLLAASPTIDSPIMEY